MLSCMYRRRHGRRHCRQWIASIQIRSRGLTPHMKVIGPYAANRISAPGPTIPTLGYGPTPTALEHHQGPFPPGRDLGTQFARRPEPPVTGAQNVRNTRHLNMVFTVKKQVGTWKRNLSHTRQSLYLCRTQLVFQFLSSS